MHPVFAFQYDWLHACFGRSFLRFPFGDAGVASNPVNWDCGPAQDRLRMERLDAGPDRLAVPVHRQAAVPVSVLYA